MASLKTVADRAGVSPQAVRKLLKKNNQLHLCYQPNSNRLLIPDDIEAEILAYYQGKREQQPVNNQQQPVNNQQQPVNNFQEQVVNLLTRENEDLRRQVEWLQEQNKSLEQTLRLSYEVLGSVSKSLGVGLTNSQMLQGAATVLPHVTSQEPQEPLRAELGSEEGIRGKVSLRERLSSSWHGLIRRRR